MQVTFWPYSRLVARHMQVTFWPYSRLVHVAKHQTFCNIHQHPDERLICDLSQHSLVQTLASFPSSVTLQFKWTASNYLITTEKEMLFCNFVRPPNMHSFVSTHPSGTHSLQLVFIAIVTGYCDMYDMQFTGNWSRWNTALLCQCV